MAKKVKFKKKASPTESYTSNRRQLYILPTRIGWIFGALLLALLIAAIRFNHQATYLLTFVLAAIGQVTSLYTHKNLLGLTLSANSVGNVFCKEGAAFSVTVANPTDSPRHAVWLICEDNKKSIELEAKQNKTIQINLATSQRGKMALAPIILSSQYPIGILFSWTRAFHSTANCIVYPEPKKLIPFPDKVESNNTSNSTASLIINKKGSDELSHTRQYQEGDRPRDIHWQAYAKHQQLVSRELVTDITQNTELNWEQVNNLALEDKLSQLTDWVLQAEENNIDYLLNIPGFKSEINQGESHKQRCLLALALFEQTKPTNNHVAENS